MNEIFENGESVGTAKLCECERAPVNMKFLNQVTGELIKINCKAYVCQYCGPRKARRLQNAIEGYLKQFEYIRMWTFTLSSRFFDNLSHLTIEERRILNERVFQEAWQNCWKEIRRCNMLTRNQQRCNYISVNEQHKSGYLHRHVFITEWLDANTLRYLWRDALQKALRANKVYFAGYVGNVHVKGDKNAGQAAAYVTKYLMKGVKENAVFRRRWSRSNGASIYGEKSHTVQCWTVIKFNINNTVFEPEKYKLLGEKLKSENSENANLSPTEKALILKALSISTQEEAPPRLSSTLFDAEFIQFSTKTPENYSNTDPLAWIWESFGE